MMGEFIGGILIGMFICFGVATMSGSKIDDYDKAKDACEKSLPRDQHCVIIAIPVSKD
jgi:hypothetical protein